MLKAVILAGGRGERLRPLTDNIPKPMVSIGAKPFLQYQIELLKKNQISEIVLCVGYLKEKVIDYFGDGSSFAVKLEYSIEKSFLDTGGALKNAKRLLPERFMILNGDSYLPIDYIKLFDFSLGCKNMGILVCYDNRDGIVRNNLYLDDTRIISRYDKDNPDKEMNYVDAGVSIFTKEVLDFIPGNRAVSLEKEIFPCLIRRKELIGYPTGQRFYDIGTPTGFRQIREALR